MKLSLKILFTFLVIILLLTTASFIYVRIVSETEPAEVVDGLTGMIYDESPFKSIEVRRGEWDIRIIQSDSFYVSIQGGDNLLKNYLKVDVVDSLLVIDLDSAMISEKLSAVITVAMPYLHSVKINNSSFFDLKDFNQTNIQVDISAGGISIKNCRIENLTVKASGDSYVGISESVISTFDYSIQDSAYVLVRGTFNSNYNRIENMGLLVNIPNDEDILISISEQRKKLTNQMNSYWGGLKWYMPIDSVIQIMEKDSMNFRMSDDDLRYLPRYFTARQVLTYYNITDDNPEIENVQLVFYRGLLTDIIINYYSFTDLRKIYSDYYSLFTEKYGEQFEHVNKTIFEADWIEEYEYYWRAGEVNPENQFTIIRLMKDDKNWMSVSYSSSRNSIFSRNIERLNERGNSNFKSFPTIVDYFMSIFRVPGKWE